MSQKRQRPALFRAARHGSGDIVTLSYDYPNGYAVPEHFHAEDQFVHAVSGVMTVRTRKGMWVVPPQRAVWVPSRVPHAIDMSGAVTMKTLYITPRLAKGLPRRCCVINVSALLRELVLRACDSHTLDSKIPKQAHLVGLILDELEASPSIPLQLPNPRDPRALRVAQMLTLDPGDRRSLDQLCKAVGASKRTIERVFRAETKLTFGKWRQQLSLLHGLRLLAAGAKVSSAAVDAGYKSASAFISMFRHALGTTPGEYFGQASRR
jgi:AraC-like DNA-binding protein/mannose-6-phosphate isomerase-like protein (cupin superfamily)